jgi:hypothetical protein
MQDHTNLSSSQLPPRNPFLNLLPWERTKFVPFQLALLQNHRRDTGALALVLNMASKYMVGYATEVIHGQSFDAIAHLHDANLMAVNLDLTAKILQFHHAGFQVHQQ